MKEIYKKDFLKDLFSTGFKVPVKKYSEQKDTSRSGTKKSANFFINLISGNDRETLLNDLKDGTKELSKKKLKAENAIKSLNNIFGNNKKNEKIEKK
jgi:hypothetical protein